MTSTYQLVAITIHNNDEAVLVANPGHPTILAVVDMVLSQFQPTNPIPILEVSLLAMVMFPFQLRMRRITISRLDTEPSRFHPIVRHIIISHLGIIPSPFQLTLHHHPTLLVATVLSPFQEEWSIPIPVDLGLGYPVPMLAVQYHPHHSYRTIGIVPGIQLRYSHI